MVLQNIASVAQSLLPDADNTRDLGSSSYRWRNGHFYVMNVYEDLFVGIVEKFGSWGNEPSIPRLNDVLSLADQRFTVTVSASPTSGSVSSMFDHSFETSARWDTSVTYPVTIEIDLGGTYHYFTTIGIYFVYGRYPGYVKIEFYNTDTSSWQTLKEVSGNTSSHVYWLGYQSYFGKIRITLDEPTANPHNEIAVALIYAESSHLMQAKGGGHPHFPDLMINGYEIITSSRVLQNIASIAQTLLPSSANAYDIGSSSYPWKDLWLGGHIYVGDFSADQFIKITSASPNYHYIGNCFTNELGIQPHTYFNIFLGHSYGGTWGDNNSVVFNINNLGNVAIGFRYASNFKLEVDGSVGPHADKTYDFGSSSYRWRRGYFQNAGSVLLLYGDSGNSTGAGNPFIEIREDGVSSYWIINKRGSAYSGQPDWLIISYYDGSSWHQVISLDGLNNAARLLNCHPFSSDSYDLGSNSYRWRDAYISNIKNLTTLTTDLLTPEADAVVLQPLNANSSNLTRNSPSLLLRGKYYDLGTSTMYNYDARLFFRVTSVAPTGELVFKIGSDEYFRAGDHGFIVEKVGLYPGVDESLNLGSSSYKWKNLHVTKIYLYNPPDWTGSV